MESEESLAVETVFFFWMGGEGCLTWCFFFGGGGGVLCFFVFMFVFFFFVVFYVYCLFKVFVCLVGWWFVWFVGWLVGGLIVCLFQSNRFCGVCLFSDGPLLEKKRLEGLKAFVVFEGKAVARLRVALLGFP